MENSSTRTTVSKHVKAKTGLQWVDSLPNDFKQSIV